MAGISAENTIRWERLPDLPDAEGFAAPFAGVADGRLVVAGGANFHEGKRPWEGGTKHWYDDIYTLGGADARWERAGRLPRVTAYGAAVTTAEGMVCAGGGDAREHFRHVYLLGLNGGKVTVRDFPPLPRACAFMGGARVGKFFYLAGGVEKPGAVEAMHTFWSLDLDQPLEGWKELPPWPGPARILPVAGASGDEFYLFSGASLTAGADGKPVRTFLRDAYAYRAGRGWRRLAELPRVAVAAPSPAPLTPGGRLLILSGDDGTRTHLDGPGHPGFPQDGWAYHPADNRWSRAPDVPFSRATVHTAEWNGRWIIPSGERRPGYRSPEVWAELRVAP